MHFIYFFYIKQYKNKTATVKSYLEFRVGQWDLEAYHGY